LREMEEGSTSVHRRLLARRRAAAVPVHIPPAVSEPTQVSPPRSEAKAPPARTPLPPPVSGVAATMIGVAPHARSSTSPLGVPRAAPSPLARPLAEKRAPGAPFTLPPNPLAQPTTEKRVPGAAFTLPANPLSDLNASDLASFIDSTLFESDDEDATAELPARPGGEGDQAIERLGSGRPVEVLPEPTSPTIVDEMAPARAAAPLPSPLLAMPAPRGARLVAARARRLTRRAAPYLLGVVVGLAIGQMVRRPTTPPPAAPAAEVKPEAAPVAAAEAKREAPVAEAEAKREAPVAAAPDTARAPAPVEAKRDEAQSAPPMEPRPARSGPEPARHHGVVAAAGADPGPGAGGELCSAKIVTEPDEARVLWRGKVLGKSPLTGAPIPCGAGTLTISHERYETVTRELTAEAGAPLAISERLHRPAATLLVASSPPGATITVNGQLLGAAPRRVPTSRYEHVSIRALLPGYAPWTKKVYLSEATTKVTAQLAAGRGR
jgi:PEGA domain